MAVFWAVVPCSLADGRWALMMEGSTSETSVNFYQTTRRNNPEDSQLWIDEMVHIPLLNWFPHWHMWEGIFSRISDIQYWQHESLRKTSKLDTLLLASPLHITSILLFLLHISSLPSCTACYLQCDSHLNTFISLRAPSFFYRLKYQTYSPSSISQQRPELSTWKRWCLCLANK
jgi:hypothetical protein